MKIIRRKYRARMLVRLNAKGELVEITTAINPDGSATKKPKGKGWKWIPVNVSSVSCEGI